MGASNCLYIFDYSKPRDKILKEWKQMQDKARRVYGSNPYNGTISTMGLGIHFMDHRLDDERTADQWLMDHHEKGDQAEAVSFFDKKDGNKIKWAIGGWCAE